MSTPFQEKPGKEHNDVPNNRIQEDLEHIKSWLAKQPHLKARTDDKWLLNFLRGSKFSLERTKQKLDLYYTMRSLVPEYFSNRDPFLPEIQEYFEKGITVVLPKAVDSTGERICIVRPKYANPDIITPTVIGKAATMMLDILLVEDDNFVVSGAQSINDLEDIPYKYGKTITPAHLKKWVIVTERAYPLKLKGVHFTNTPTFIQPLLHLMKHFVSDKIKSRIHFYMDDNMKEMYNHIPSSILPHEYGGQAGPIDEMRAQLKAKVESYRDWFIEDAQYGSDETKRPEKPITSTDMFGMEGSFRKLEVD